MQYCSATGSLINIVGGMQSPSPTCLTSFECFDVATREYFERVADYPHPVAGLGLCAMRRKQTQLVATPAAALSTVPTPAPTTAQSTVVVPAAAQSTAPITVSITNK